MDLFGMKIAELNLHNVFLSWHGVPQFVAKIRSFSAIFALAQEAGAEEGWGVATARHQELPIVRRKTHSNVAFTVIR